MILFVVKLFLHGSIVSNLSEGVFKEDFLLSHSKFFLVIFAVFILLGSLRLFADTKQNEFVINSAKDLANKKAAVRIGEINENITAAVYPDAKVVGLTDSAQIVLTLRQHKADFYIADKLTASFMIDTYPDLCLFPEVVFVEVGCFGVRKDARGEQIVKDFNVYLDGIRKNGEYDKMYDRWVNSPESTWSMPDFNFTDTKGTLLFAPDKDWAPYGFVKDGILMGFQNELVLSFCEAMGYMPKYELVEYSAALVGMSAGKYDFLAIWLMKTKEREEVINFTEPIISNPYYPLVRRENVPAEVLAKIDAESGFKAEDTTGTKFQQLWKGLKTSFEKNFIRESRWKMLLEGFWTTVKLSVLSAIFGTLLGALICALRRMKNPILRGFAKIYVKIFQGTPVVVLLLVLYYVIFGSSDISAFVVSVLGFSLDLSAYVSEMIRSGIESVPAGQSRAALALGYGRFKAFFTIVLPQAIRHIMPVYCGQLIAMVKLTSVAGYISVEDLTKVSDIIRARTFEAFFPLITTALIYFIFANILILVLKLLQNKVLVSKRSVPKGVK